MSLKKIFQAKGPGAAILSVALSVLVTVSVVQAATTISTNISTGGTLTVSDSISASSTLLVTGAVTTYGNSTFGDAATDVNLFTGLVQASTTALFTGGVTFYGNLTIDKAATTTVTFSDEGINFDSNTLVLDPNANRVGVLTATPNTTFEVVGTASTTNLVVGGGTSVANLVYGTCTYNPGGAITASTTLSTNCTSATGVTSTHKVFVTPVGLPNGLVLVSASSTADNVIQVSVHNIGHTGNVTPASATWNWMAVR